MGVSVHVDRHGVKRYRVRRVINGHRLVEVFPLTESGLAEATLLDNVWAEEQKAARIEQLKEPSINDLGLLKGMYFHIRKNKIGPDNIYLRMRIPHGKTIEKIVKDTTDVFDFIAENLPIYKECYSEESFSMGYYFLTAEKIFPDYKREYLRYRKLVDLDYKTKTAIIKSALERQQKLSGGK